MLRTVVVLVALCVSGDVAAEQLRAPDGTVKDVPEASVEYALRDGYTRLGTLYFRRADGGVAELIDDPEAERYAAREGWWKMGDAEIADYKAKRAERRAQQISDEVADEMRWWRKPGNIAVIVGVALGLAILLAYSLRKKS